MIKTPIELFKSIVFTLQQMAKDLKYNYVVKNSLNDFFLYQS